jgi:hypothetical protein
LGLFLIATAALIAATLASACDDGQDGASGSPTATATGVPEATSTPSPEQQLLEQVVLQAEDLPEGLVQVSAIASPNEDAAQAAANPEEELARLESWGRLFGYDVTFLPGPDSPSDLAVVGVNSTASIYVTSEGASASFADDVEAARSQDWALSYPDLVDLDIREMERPQLADQIVWIRIAGHQEEASGSLYMEDFVVLREGRLRGFLRVTLLFPASASPDDYLEETTNLAARQVERMDAALGES